MTVAVSILLVAACVTAYEVGGARRDPARPARRRACAWAAAALAAGATVGPLGGRHPTLWEESLQYAVLLFAVAPLVALAAPRASGRALRLLPDAGPRWWVGLVAYLAVMVAWRLPGPVDAIATLRPLVVVEGVSLVAGSHLLWCDLTGAPWPPRPPMLRMAMAAAGVWSVWLLGLVVGSSTHPWYPAYSGGPAGHIGAVASQELAVAILWVASGLAFVPAVFATMARWFAPATRAEQAERRARIPAASWAGARRAPWSSRRLDGSHGA